MLVEDHLYIQVKLKNKNIIFLNYIYLLIVLLK